MKLGTTIKHSEILDKIRDWKIERDAGALGYGKIKCAKCNGEGYLPKYLRCSECDGEGFVWAFGGQL